MCINKNKYVFCVALQDLCYFNDANKSWEVRRLCKDTCFRIKNMKECGNIFTYFGLYSSLKNYCRFDDLLTTIDCTQHPERSSENCISIDYGKISLNLKKNEIKS